MAISHELSTEIATALLTGKNRSQRELNDLKKMLLEIHSTLERLSVESPDKCPSKETDSPPLTKAIGSSA